MIRQIKKENKITDKEWEKKFREEKGKEFDEEYKITKIEELKIKFTEKPVPIIQ